MFSEYRLVDLTLPLNAKTVTLTGHCGFHIENKLDYETDGIRVLKFSMHAGMGTHMDAPSHFFKEGKQVADIPLEDLFVKLVVLNLSHDLRPDRMLHADDILSFEREHQAIEPGSLFCYYSGWSKHLPNVKDFLNREASGRLLFLGYDPSAAELLLERDVVGIGIDTTSPDGSNQTDFPVHHLILGEGKYILENVANLDQCPPIGAYVVSLPLRITEGTESGVRSVALIKR